MSFNGLLCNSFFINGHKQVGIPQCQYRISIDPTSNPDPFTNGLIVTSASTQPLPAIFNVPLTIGPITLGIASPFSRDPENCITVGTNTITINRTGIYQISMMMLTLSNLATPNNLNSCQVLRNGQSIFTAPTAVGSATPFFTIAGTPVAGIYNLASPNDASALCSLTAGDVLVLVYWLLFDSAVIELTSNISINLIG